MLLMSVFFTIFFVKVILISFEQESKHFCLNNIILMPWQHYFGKPFSKYILLMRVWFSYVIPTWEETLYKEATNIWLILT